MSTDTPASVTSQSFCSICYMDAIERLCDGFTIIYANQKTVIAVPPLSANVAEDVRKAARQHVERHGPGNIRRHPYHAGARH
jgi:hypothetical protein